jgi:hypothetical protein
LQVAIASHRDYIAGETLVLEWPASDLNGDVHQTEGKVDGQPLTIKLRRLPSA